MSKLKIHIHMYDIYYIIRFGESYNDLYPGTIYSPPSYDVRFPSAIMSSWYYLFTFIGIFDYENINTLVWDRLFQLFYSFEE